MKTEIVYVPAASAAEAAGTLIAAATPFGVLPLPGDLFRFRVNRFGRALIASLLVEYPGDVGGA